MTDEKLARTAEMLATTRLGLDDMRSTDRTRRMTELRNLIVFGRTVTLTLQTLKTTEPRFAAWYVKEQEAMKADPLMKCFLDFRNDVVHEGKLNVSTSAFIKSFSSSDLEKFPRPRGATSFFIGDQIGGSGWEVALADGTTERYYVSLPSSVGTVKQVFNDIPDKFPQLQGRDIDDMCKEYFDKLSDLVKRATAEFATRKPSGRPNLRLVKS